MVVLLNTYLFCKILSLLSELLWNLLNATVFHLFLLSSLNHKPFETRSCVQRNTVPPWDLIQCRRYFKYVLLNWTAQRIEFCACACVCTFNVCSRLTVLKIKTVFENVRALMRNLKITTEK